MPLILIKEPTISLKDTIFDGMGIVEFADPAADLAWTAGSHCQVLYNHYLPGPV
jgi:hypothetical protein